MVLLRIDGRHLRGDAGPRLHLPAWVPPRARAVRRAEPRARAQCLGLRPVPRRSEAAPRLEPQPVHRQPRGQGDRLVGAAQQSVRAAAQGEDHPVRPREARLAGRRRRAPDPQVHERRQAGDVARRVQGARQRREALQPPDRHRLAARRHVLRERRLREHARGEVRQERQVPDAVGPAGERAERDAARVHEHGAG
jgi:hypothetical protein